MSSHHIVRDKQEPALLLADTKALPLEWIEELLGWSPVVFVPFPGLYDVIKWGIKIDVAVVPHGRKDETLSLLAYQAPFTVETSESPIVLALLEAALAHHHPACHLISFWDDHMLLFNTIKPFLASMQMTIWKHGVKAFGLEAGKFEKWAIKNTVFRVVSDGLWKAEGDVFVDDDSVTYLSDGSCRFILSAQALLVEQFAEISPNE